jgi:hypothetical protein
MYNEIEKVIANEKVETSTAVALQSAFMPFFEKAEEWKEKALALVVTDATQVTEIKQAREARLIMRQIRIDADKTRKALKEDSLRYGKAVQGVYNVIEFLISPIEEHLEKQEKFAENAEKARQELARQERTEMLKDLQAYLPPCGDLGIMAQHEFDRLLSIGKTQKELAEKEAEAKRLAELDAIEAENRERERIKAENEALKVAMLKAEAERKQAEAVALAERQEAEKKLKAEQAERARVEAEIRAKAEADRKQAEAVALAEKKAKSAPDKEKLIALACFIDSILIPDLSSAECLKIAADAKVLLAKTASYIREKTAGL